MIVKDNIYTTLYFQPALKRWQMPPVLEELAKALVASGRLRIDAEDKVNFVRFSHPGERIHRMFSHRELHDETLLPKTLATIRQDLSSKYSGQTLEDNTYREIERLRYDVAKILGVDAATEIQLARIVVQSAEPCVIQLLLLEDTELYVSYAYTVGDMLDMKSWQTVGSSSGLQSTDFRQSSVFISSAGNPLRVDKINPDPNDGFPALARLIVIGGQELGHYADIRRNRHGHPVGRFSCRGYAPDPVVRQARLRDIEHVQTVISTLEKLHIKRITEMERHASFYRKQKNRRFERMNLYRKIDNQTRRLFRQSRRHGVGFIGKTKADEEGHKASAIMAMAWDMHNNLSPKADAYKRKNPVEEEAVACAEALARVPQQVNKWGHEVTRAMMPGLYEIYYQTVIPACKAACETLSGQPFRLEVRPRGWWRKWWGRIWNRESRF